MQDPFVEPEKELEERAKLLDEYLNEVDYSALNGTDYVPSKFALMFMHVIKLINTHAPEDNTTPPVHLRMLDLLSTTSEYVLNLCHRGLGKTTLMFEYLALYIAMIGGLPTMPNITGIIYVSDSVENGVAVARKNIEARYNNSPFLQEQLPHAKFTERYIEFRNKEGKWTGIKLYGAQSGIRGSRIFNRRPQLAILDDLLSDEDARSAVALSAIKDTIYNGVNHALDPKTRKIIFNGTPFNKNDPLIEAVESGAWSVNIWPICEKFPVEKEHFRGSWEDRFPYEYVLSQYHLAVKTKKLSAFFQELMLRISSEEERLVQESEIIWYNRKILLQNKGAYNFYITTDYAYTTGRKSDNVVISVWAYNHNGDWFWVDGICRKQKIDKTMDDLFDFVDKYKPKSVGIEANGVQTVNIEMLRKEMNLRGTHFNLASSKKNRDPGISPSKDKLTRFNTVVPLFSNGKIFWPEEMKQSQIMGTFHNQIRMVTNDAIKGGDDCIDTISMLHYMKPWKPVKNAIQHSDTGSESRIYGADTAMPVDNPLSSYIV